MLKQFQEFIERQGLCTRQARLLVAVSGGLDSMVLCHLFRQSGYFFSVAHANFQLRGSESDRDEVFVKEHCAEFGIPFFSHRFDTNNYAIEKGLSVQMAARELRYGWFRQIAAVHSLDFIVTAHHASDQVETQLLNWVHGQSVKGFLGIPLRNKNIIRPLLFATRAQIEHYAAAQKIVWREDESNSGCAYERNKLRHQVLPVLKELNPSLEATLQRTRQIAAGEEELINWALADWRKKFQTGNENEIHFSKEGFLQVRNTAVLLHKLISEFGFNFPQCQQIMGSVDSQSGRQFFSPSHVLVLDRETILVAPLKDRSMVRVQINLGDKAAALGHLQLTVEWPESVSIERSASIAVLDADKIHFPLVWRYWQDGDRFYPLGMSNSKKVSDYLIDKKISMIAKQRCTVLVSGTDIIWVVGERVDNRYKVTEATQRVLRLSLTMIDSE